MSGLTEANEIISIISGITVVGGAAVAIVRCSAFFQLLIRIAQGHPQREDIDNIEEGIATDPAVREAVANAQRALRAAGLQEAAQNVARVRDHAHQRAASPQPRNIQLRQPGRAVRVDTQDRATNTVAVGSRGSPLRARDAHSGSQASSSDLGVSNAHACPQRLRNARSSSPSSGTIPGDIETGFLPVRLRNMRLRAENRAPNPREPDEDYLGVNQSTQAIASSSGVAPKGHGQSRERLGRGTLSLKGGKTGKRLPHGVARGSVQTRSL